jgi:hypothetical protein
MKRLYAEVFALFYRFYVRRSDLNPTLSAGALVSAVQVLWVMDLALVLHRLDVSIVETRTSVFVIVGGLLFINYLILRAGRAADLLALVADSSLRRGRWVFLATAIATALAMLLNKRILIFA